ncbi:hypothetical protein EMCG_08058 [[Emmonsia] crescens]|uniref:Uncharacterized protein n=1 Tax=[Emmonsia] crescens TaxID=73230 RepID=A0A0G2I6A5_9EURO|nr:hypothetical protein EMCG_08058 [Emmonsia crescens UAMH 3008]
MAQQTQGWAAWPSHKKTNKYETGLSKPQRRWAAMSRSMRWVISLLSVLGGERMSPPLSLGAISIHSLLAADTMVF